MAQKEDQAKPLTPCTEQRGLTFGKWSPASWHPQTAGAGLRRQMSRGVWTGGGGRADSCPPVGWGICNTKLCDHRTDRSVGQNLACNLSAANIVEHILYIIIVQSLSCVQLFATPWTAACQTSLSSTISWSLLRFTSIELVMLSDHLVLCCPLLLLPQSFPVSGSFPVSRLFPSSGPSIGASASASLLPMNIQG